MKREKIAVISDDYPSEGRMVFVFVQQLVEALVDEGQIICVVAPQSLVRAAIRGVKLMPTTNIHKTSLGNCYTVYRPYSLSFGNGNKFLYRIAEGFNRQRLTKCLKTISPKIIYGHFWHNAMKAEKYAVDNNLPLFVACGEGDDALDNWASLLSKEAKEQIRNNVRGVISVSTENKRKCLKYGISTENKIIVLPNCVNDKLFHPIESYELRRKMGISDCDFVVSYTGAFIKRKGYDRLSAAINSIDNEKLKVVFMGKPMPGHDNEMPTCNGIVYCSSVNHDNLPEYLCASDVFVLPTLKEGCSNAIVEALACGLPVISSDRPFNDDILNEHNSILVDPENIDDIAMAIKSLMDNKDKYNMLKQYTLAHASEFSIKRRAQRIMEFINEQNR